MSSPGTRNARADDAGWNPTTLAVLSGLWIATLGNWPLWRALVALPETDSARGLVFMLGFATMLAALLTALLCVFAWRFSIKVVIGLFLISAALGAHFMGAYGVVIDPTMMANVLQTDLREASDLMNVRLLVSVVVLAGLPLLWLWRVRVQRNGWGAQLARNGLALVVSLVMLAGLLFALFADLSAIMRNHKSMRYLINPVNSFYALGALAKESTARPKGPPETLAIDAQARPPTDGRKPPLLLLVVGETARSDHFSLNGYARATNPELAAQSVISFRDVTSCGTNTAASLPCMFSHLGRQAYESREHDHENLLDAVQRAGLAVLWLDNQSGCKGICARIPNAFARDAAPGGTPPPAALCTDGECLDEALLHGLDARLAALPSERRARGVLLVLHQMGSHGPAYFKRSPPERKPFLPECTTNALQQCEHQALLNAYDNSIAYTDHVLSLTIDWLKRNSRHYDPLLLYVSDHGESLGENNLYLHGLPYALAPREQKHVPMLLWLPAQTEASSGISARCLRGRRDAPLTHDHLFHTVLQLVGVSTSVYRGELDAFAPCRTR